MSKPSFGKCAGSTLCCVVLLAAFLNPAKAGATDSCPTDADEIATDRLDVTNSSLVSFRSAASKQRTAAIGPSGTVPRLLMELTRDYGSASLIARNS
jgi:hypothetical protein